MMIFIKSTNHLQLFFIIQKASLDSFCSFYIAMIQEKEKKEGRILPFRIKKQNKNTIIGFYQNKNPDIRLAYSLIQNNQVEFKKAMKDLSKEQSNFTKVQLFYKLFAEIKQKDADSYCIDNLLSAYHFEDLQLIKEVKQKINLKSTKFSDFANKEKIVLDMQKNITESIQLKKMTKIMEYLQKGNYFDAKKVLLEIQNIQIQEFFSFFSFCKIEYKKLMVGNYKVKDQNQDIQLTTLDKLASNSVSQLSQLEAKQELSCVLKCNFLMRTYRIKDFNFIASKLKDENFKNSLIQANRVVFNMNVFVKFIKTLQKDQKFTFQSFSGQMYGQFQYLSFLKDHLQAVNFYLDFLNKIFKGDEKDIKINEIELISLKIFPYSKIKLQQLKKSILNAKKSSNNSKQKIYDQLLAWYAKKFNRNPINLAESIIEILNNFYENHKNNPNLLNQQCIRQKQVNKFQKMKQASIKQDLNFNRFNKSIKFIDQMYQFTQQSIKNNSKNVETSKNYSKQKKEQILNKSSNNKEETQIIINQPLQNLKEQLNNQKKQHQKTKKKLQLAQRPLKDYNQLKESIKSQRQQFQKQFNDSKSKYEAIIRVKKEEIKKLQIELNNLKKMKVNYVNNQSQQQFQKRLSEQKIKFQERYENQMTEFVNQTYKNRIKYQKQMREQKQENQKQIRIKYQKWLKELKQQNQKQIRIKQRNFNQEKLKLQDAIKNQKDSFEKQIRINEREYQRKAKQFQQLKKKKFQQLEKKFQILQQDKHQVDIDIKEYKKAADKKIIQVSLLTAEKQKFVLKLQRKLKQTQKKLEESEIIIKDFTSSFQGNRLQQNKIDYLKQRHKQQKNKLLNSLNLKQQELDEKNFQIKFLRQKQLQVQKSLNQQVYKLNTTQELIQNLNKQIQKNIQQIETKKAKILQFSQKLGNKQNQISEKTKQVRKKTKQIYDMKEQNYKKTQQFQQEISQKQQKITDLTLKLNQQAQRNKKHQKHPLQQTIKQKNTKIVQLSQQIKQKTQKIQQKQRQNQETVRKLNQKIQQLQKTISQLSQKIKEQDQKNKSLSLTSQQGKNTKVEFQQENRKLKGQVKGLNKQLEEIKSQYQRLKLIKQKQLNDLSKATLDLSSLKHQNNLNWNQNLLLLKQITNWVNLLLEKLEISLQSINENCIQISPESSQQASNKQESIQQHIKYQQKYSIQLINKNNAIIQKIKKIILFIQTERNVKKQKQQQEQKQRQEKKKQKKLKEHKEQNQILNKTEEFKRLLLQKNQQLAIVKQKYQRQSEIIKQDYAEEIEKIKNKLIDFEALNNHLSSESSKIKKKIEEKDQTLKEIEEKSSSNRFYEMYFQGDVFDSEPYNQLVWFVDELQKNCQKRIKKTRLLYRKDDYSIVNFHVYFDNLQDIVLVIKLKNGMVLAGYTHPAFIKGQKQPGQDGFIFSFHKHQVFGQKREGIQNMEPKPRPITYDEYYMIYGNSQIRLRFREDMLFSNFGIMDAFYDNRKQPVDILLGEGKQRESQIQTYEIFQVKFYDNFPNKIKQLSQANKMKQLDDSFWSSSFQDQLVQAKQQLRAQKERSKRQYEFNSKLNIELLTQKQELEKKMSQILNQNKELNQKLMNSTNSSKALQLTLKELQIRYQQLFDQLNSKWNKLNIQMEQKQSACAIKIRQKDEQIQKLNNEIQSLKGKISKFLSQFTS